MKCSTDRCRSDVFEEIDRGLNQFMKGVMSGNVVTSEDPRISVMEFNDKYVVECDLPGVNVENVAVQLEDNVLSITGKRSSVVNDDGAASRVILNERSVAEFTRQVRLSKDVDQSAVDAELKNGVLLITIPKRPEVLPQKIEIKRG